jgi:RimJ/RimL family protein N-acetyltransferase
MSLLPVSLATDRDIAALLQLATSCIGRMREEGIEQWDEIYPSETDLRRDIAAQALWILREREEIVGCMTLDANQDPLWDGIDWQFTAGPIAAVHRLMVSPSHQRRGLARRLMAFAEAQACRTQRAVVRLDAFVQNRASMALYEKLGYRHAGTAMMRKGLFAGFEKNLTLSTEPWPQPESREFAGRHITLRPMNLDEDTEELFAISHVDAQARELWRYLPWGPFAEMGELREHYQEFREKAGALAFTVFQNESRQRVGSLSLMNIRPEHGVAEVGFVWYAPVARGTKANMEANYLLLRHCFEDLRYRRMEWKCDAANEPSHRAALRLGYRYEGTFRQHMVIKGRNRDTAWFAIVDHEWPRVRARMEERLY